MYNSTYRRTSRHVITRLTSIFDIALLYLCTLYIIFLPRRSRHRFGLNCEHKYTTHEIKVWRWLWRWKPWRFAFVQRPIQITSGCKSQRRNFQVAPASATIYYNLPIPLTVKRRSGVWERGWYIMYRYVYRSSLWCGGSKKPTWGYFQNIFFLFSVRPLHTTISEYTHFNPCFAFLYSPRGLRGTVNHSQIILNIYVYILYYVVYERTALHTQTTTTIYTPSAPLHLEPEDFPKNTLHVV